MKSLFIALALFASATVLGSSASALSLALDATETLSNFKIEGDLKETPSQILITNMTLSYESSKSGAQNDPLRLKYEATTQGATAVCLYFGATKVIDYNGTSGRGTDRVLIVDLSKGKVAYNWLIADSTFQPSEILCEK